MDVVHTVDRFRKGGSSVLGMGRWNSISYLYKSDVAPGELGPIGVQNINTFCEFFRTGFYSSGRKQYSERCESNFLNVYEGPPDRLSTSLFKGCIQYLILMFKSI